MRLGKQIRDAFLQAAEVAGQTVNVRRPIEDGAEPLFEAFATVGKEFHFTEMVNIQVGSVLQVKGSRDYYRVIDTRDAMQAGEFIYLAAIVQKIDSAGFRTASANHGTNIFNAPIHGGLQIGGSGNIQTNNVAAGESVESVISQLVNLLSTANIDALQRDDAVEAAQRLATFAKTEHTPDVLSRVNDRLELIKSTLEMSSDLAKLGMPLLTILASYFK